MIRRNYKTFLLYLLLVVLCSALVSCRNTPPAEQQLTVEIVALPEALAGLPIGASIKYQDWYYTKVNDSLATRTMPQLQPVIKKCKNCFNQTDKHKDKSKSKAKEKTETVIKNKQDQSTQKKAETDNSIGKTEAKSTIWDEVKGYLILFALLAGVLLVWKVFR